MKKDPLIKILSAIALALVVFGLVYATQKKERKEKSGIVTKEEFQIPPLLENRKTFVITDVNKNLYKAKNGSGEEISIFVPQGVTPNLIGVKEIKTGYYAEIFKYREVAEGLIAHALNITATDPHKQFPTALTPAEKTVGGLVKQIEKSSFIIAYAEPGGKNNKTYQVGVSADTVFIKVDIVSQTKETKTNFANMALDQSVVVHYVQNSEDIKATKVEILSEFRLPIGEPPK
ncbi:MAG: hypothetical protein Q8R29_00430 [bacterium]|nr:hypothetical protein [bacterium]